MITIGELPKSLVIGGQSYPIRSDFRMILRIYAAFDDDEISEYDKAYVCMKCLYPDYDDIPQEHLQEACDKAYWFVGGGDMPRTEPEEVKMIDWKQDENILFPAINKTAGCEIRTCEYMHWWTFLGLFGEIGEGLFSTVMNIRQKKAQGKPLEKWEQEFYRKNKNLIIIKTAEDKEAEAELKQVLDELI